MIICKQLRWNVATEKNTGITGVPPLAAGGPTGTTPYLAPVSDTPDRSHAVSGSSISSPHDGTSLGDEPRRCVPYPAENPPQTHPTKTMNPTSTMDSKANILSDTKKRGLSYRIVSVGDDEECGEIKYLGESTVTADELVAPRRT
jgi:hypothetical protein